jgi:hypothetical protein
MLSKYTRVKEFNPKSVCNAEVWGAALVGAGLIVSAGASVFSTLTQKGIANSQLGIEEDQLGKQDQSFQQLQQLLTNPQSFFDSPVFKSAADQGGAQVARQNAAAFGPNSGNEAQALQAYGQTFGQQQLLGQEELLAGMSGTGFNPSTAASGASSAISSATASANSLAGMLAFFGTQSPGTPPPADDFSFNPK